MPISDLPAQGLYSPLSQNMTDSESSEEEIHSSAATVGSNRITKGSNIRKMSINTHILGSMHEVNCNNYSNINSDGEDHHHHHHNHMDPDNVAILNRSALNSKGSEPISSLRKFCFVLSLLVCVLTVVLFLWVIPCSDELTCPSKRIKTHNWLRNYERIEMKGGINVVDGLRGRSKNLVFMYRADKLWSDIDPINYRKRNGIISLMGSNGKVGWFDEIVNEPSIIDCTLIDADRNGSPDCLVLDEFGELDCINPISGQWIWHLVDETVKKRQLLTFPLILPDLNKDGVNELLVTTNSEQHLYNAMVIVSGANGVSLGLSHPITECSYIHKFQLDQKDRKYQISFNCIKNDTEIQKVKALDELYRLITNKPMNLPLDIPLTPISQHKFYGQRKDTLNQRNIYSVSGKQLIVENNGKCPDTCNVTVQLTEQRNGKEHIIRNFNGSRMYGMVPALLSFNATSADAKSSIHGFVIKFWEWSLNETDIQYQLRHKRSTSNGNEFNRFADVLQRKTNWQMPNGRYERSAESKPINSSKESIIQSKMRLIKETVVLIVFNSTDTRIENTSQSNIIQFCREDGTEVMCQPDLNYQENSVLIADLDQDGSQELVTYYTTYVNTGDDSKMEWKLITYVQLLRLEAELPKLYIVDDRV